MENKLKNPIAFPQDANTCLDEFRGMTLRDYFASKAMQGQLSDLETIRAMAQDAKGPFNEYLAKESYKIADAMLNQREK
jgi:hypothetical protein